MSEERPTFEIRLHGVRGSLSVSGEATAGFGGATICIEARTAGRVMIFDAGSGAHPAGRTLRAEGVRHVDLFLSHWHYDHVIGLPFFAPLHAPGTEVVLWSGHGDLAPGKELLAGFMRPPYFPVGPEIFAARLSYRDFVPPAVLEPGPGVIVRTLRLRHPGGATAYRVESGDKVFCVVTDLEHVPGRTDPEIVDFVKGADLVLYDAMFEDCDMEMHCGYGHSSWQQALRVCEPAGVKRVGFIHHAPLRDDAALDRIDRLARERFPGAFAARQGMTLRF